MVKQLEDGIIEHRNQSGHLHREDGPAYERPDGLRIWFQHGQLHREDGPPLEMPDGSTEHFILGQPLTVQQFRLRQELADRAANILSRLGASSKPGAIQGCR